MSKRFSCGLAAAFPYLGPLGTFGRCLVFYQLYAERKLRLRAKLISRPSLRLLTRSKISNPYPSAIRTFPYKPVLPVAIRFSQAASLS